MNVICELVCVSYDHGPSLSGFVSQVVSYIKSQSSLAVQLTPMGTIVEGEWSAVSALINGIMERFAPQSERMGLTIRIDYHRGRQNMMAAKIKSVEDKLGGNQA